MQLVGALDGQVSDRKSRAVLPSRSASAESLWEASQAVML